MVYLGTYKHNLDTKNRLTLPSKFVDKLAKEIVINKGFDGCLEIRNMKDYEVYSQEVSNLSSTSADARKYQRILGSTSNDLEIDSASRVLIPSYLLEMVNIKKSITIIGVSNKIELWDSEAYDKYITSGDSLETIGEKLYANKK